MTSLFLLVARINFSFISTIERNIVTYFFSHTIMHVRGCESCNTCNKTVQFNKMKLTKTDLFSLVTGTNMHQNTTSNTFVIYEVEHLLANEEQLVQIEACKLDAIICGRNYFFIKLQNNWLLLITKCTEPIEVCEIIEILFGSQSEIYVTTGIKFKVNKNSIFSNIIIRIQQLYIKMRRIYWSFPIILQTYIFDPNINR